jgi:hypothetical protein
MLRRVPGSTSLAEDETSPEPSQKRPARRHQAAGGRNTGWYIPFWRKPRRGQQEQAQLERSERRRKPRSRSELDVERLRNEWVDRYNARLHALNMLGLSVGTPKDDIARRYDTLRAELSGHLDAVDELEALDEAYAVLRSDQ